MIFSAFGSDCIRADSVELTAATVSASKKIRRAKSFPSEKPRRFGAPNLFDRKNLGDSARRIFLLSGNYFLPSLTHLWVVSPDFWCVESDYMCADTVHFQCGIWSLIHFYRKLGANMHFLPAA